MNDIAKIELSKDLIEPIVRAQLQASITAALGRTDQLVQQVVQTVMNLKVDSSGKVGDSWNAKTPLITWMAEDAIKQAAHEAIKEWFAENRALIKEQITKALTKNMKGMAEAYVLSLTKSVEVHTKHNIEVKFNREPA